MLNQFEKILAFGAILLIIISMLSPVFAVDSDNYISESQTSNTSDNFNNIADENFSEDEDEENEISTNTNSNTNSNTSNTSSNSTSYENYTGVPDSSATVTSYLPESDLGLTNILNILLIVVGILLILLAVAILIKLKK